MLDMADFAKRGYRRSTPHSVDDRALIAPTIEFLKKNHETGACVVLLPVLPHHPYTIPEDEFGLSFRLPNPPADNRGRTFHRYKESLAYADGVLGALADALVSASLSDDTLLIVFADHGEAFYQHPGNYLHALFVYEENVRVPFLIHNPRLFPETRHYAGVSSHVDILPTVLDLAGSSSAPDTQGVSLVAAHRARLALLHTDWEEERIGIRDGRYKYIRETGSRREELYDLETDPRERTNLAARVIAENHAAVRDLLREAAVAGRRQMEAPLPIAGKPGK
jgi:arylsulfatase A-like enzyme